MPGGRSAAAGPGPGLPECGSRRGGTHRTRDAGAEPLTGAYGTATTARRGTIAAVFPITL
jgi:hypothetical protein